ERRERRRAERHLYEEEMMRAHHYLDMNDPGDALKLLERHRPKKGEQDFRGFEWRYLWQQCQGDPHEALPRLGVWSLECSPDGRWVVSGSAKEIAVLDMTKRAIVAELKKASGEDSGPTWAVFTPDGKTLITATKHEVSFFETNDW